MPNYAGVAVIVSVLATTTVVGFSLVGQRWTTDVVPVELRLGNAAGLIDGSADWDACARQSLAAWNAVLASTAMRFTAVRGMSSSPAVAFDGINSIVFAADVFGTPFGPSLVSATQTIAIIRDGVDETIEADVLVNQSQPFNCYRGALQPGRAVHDLQRTVTHGLGHVIGLGHPDAAGQTVAALMNAEPGDVDVLQTSDIEGALTLAGMAMVGIPFPPRNEALTFYESLETEYRDTLQRAQTNEGYVDAEGSAVWFPEWLRYVLNGCEATEATTRVLMQIRGQGIQPVCRDVASDSYAFPPRNLSLDFLEVLDAFYRDELQRRVELSHVDLEGKAVWLQEYLRYRVDGVNDADARTQVLTQIQEAAPSPVPGDETSSRPPTMTHVQSITVSTGSIWSIPVYDGFHLVLSTEVIGPSGGVYMGKYDLSVNLMGTATHIVSPDDLNSDASLTYTFANNITSIADHKHIFQGGFHYITFSTSGNGSGGNLYLMKIDAGFVLQDIVEVTTDNAPTNDMFLVGDGSRVHVGKFQPGQGHDIYVFDADLNSMGAAIPIGNTGPGNDTNQHANGAAAIFHNNQLHLVAPETLVPGQGDYFYQIIFDKDWNVVRERTTILTDMTMLGIVSGLSHEPNTDTFIVHYTRGDTDGGGPIYQAIYDSNWALLENQVLISTGNYQRPHSLFVGDDLFVGYDSAGVFLSKFNVSYP
jgi:hypothetical protein